MITLERVSKQYKQVKAVDDISLSIEEGETVVLLGTSGCGKTTTLRMINRLADATAGRIMVNGKDITLQQPELLRRRIGYVLQHHGLFPHYTIAENIATVPNLLGWDQEKIKQRTFELLDKLQLPREIAEMYPSGLSGGQQQRVGLARALAGNPPVLLMDEPLGALDPVTRAGIRREFNTLDELKRKTILMVTHDVQEAFELGDRICLMDKGKIVQVGSPRELLLKPATDFVVSFLKEQRFQLELQTLSLANIWSYLPKAIDGTNEMYLQGDNNLWQTIETLSDTTAKSNRYVIMVEGGKRQVDVASLMTAYAQFKNAVKDG